MLRQPQRSRQQAGSTRTPNRLCLDRKDTDFVQVNYSLSECAAGIASRLPTVWPALSKPARARRAGAVVIASDRRCLTARVLLGLAGIGSRRLAGPGFEGLARAFRQINFSDMPSTCNPILLLRDTSQAATLLQPLRLRLVELLHEADTAAGVARKLDLPRQVVNYHLRQLEAQGLLELVEERRQGTRTERVLRARARAYVIAPEALGALAADPSRVSDRFSASYLLAVATRVIRQVGGALARAETQRKRIATLTMLTQVRFRSARERNEFAEELAAAVAVIVSKYHDETSEGGRRFELALGVYPASAAAPVVPNSDAEAK
jgi:DNA-binding transcriptional ArsR family regulator